MVRKERHHLYVGIYNSVVALDVRDGAELWRTKLGGLAYVNVLWDGEELFAATKGEVFRLDPRNGEILWHARLKGLGTGSVTLASTRAPGADSGQLTAAEQRRQAAQHSSS